MVNLFAFPGLSAAPTVALAGGNRSRADADRAAPEPIPATGSGSGGASNGADGGGSAAAAIRAQQREQADQAARQAAAEAAAKPETKAPPPREPFFQRRVGLVDGTFDVFIELVSQPPPGIVMARLFGPPASASETKAPAPLPGLAKSAYGGRAASAPPSVAVLA